MDTSPEDRSARHRIARRGVIAGGLGALATFAVVKAPAKAAQFEFKCGGAIPPDNPVSLRIKEMWNAVEKESGGRIRCQWFPNSELGGDQAMISQLRLGALPFYIGAGNLPTVVPAVEITQVAYAFKDSNEGARAARGPLGEYLGKEFAAKNLFMVRDLWDGGMRMITSSKGPIRTVEDMNGFRLRVVQSKIVIDFFKALGASPSPLSFGETYTSLQTKLVDGEDNPLTFIAAARFYEVQKYLSLTYHSWAALALVANGDVWKSLPPDLQAIIERNNTKYTKLEARDVATLGAAIIDKIARYGLAVNKTDTASFRPRLQPYYATWSSSFGPTVWGLLQNSISSKLT